MKRNISLGISILILLYLTSCVPTASKHIDGVALQDENTDEIGDDSLIASQEKAYYMEKITSENQDETIRKPSETEENSNYGIDVPVKEINPVIPSLEYNPVDADHTEKKENIKSKIPDKTANNIIRPLKQEIYSHVNEMPRFPGGEEQLKRWLKTNLLYPSSAMEDRLQGKVTVRFVVYADGSIGEIQIKKGISPVLDKEALRVVNLMPDWIPGKLDDSPVPVWCALPIVFKLQD